LPDAGIWRQLHTNSDSFAGFPGVKPALLSSLLHPRSTTRLQTLDHGAPVSLYLVSRELGHGSEEMVKRVYAHLGTIRHRSEVVEFRIEQHLEALKDRLGILRSGTRNDTTKPLERKTETPPASKRERGAKLESGPGATRTRDLLLRRQALYPTELRTLVM
jgi:hypothetical protein